jgi:hypothetical protein
MGKEKSRGSRPHRLEEGLCMSGEMDRWSVSLRPTRTGILHALKNPPQLVYAEARRHTVTQDVWVEERVLATDTAFVPVVTIDQRRQVGRWSRRQENCHAEGGEGWNWATLSE